MPCGSSSCNSMPYSGCSALNGVNSNINKKTLTLHIKIKTKILKTMMPITIMKISINISMIIINNNKLLT